MRIYLEFSLLTILTITGAQSAANTGSANTEPAKGLKPVAGAQPIGAVKLDATRLVTSVNKSELIESESAIRRVSVGNPDMVEVVAVSNRELVLNAKAAGETTLIVWSAAGRKPFDVVVMPVAGKVDSVREEFKKEFDGQDVTLTFEEGNVFLRGTVKDMTAAGRAVAIASTLGKVVNLLHVEVPPSDYQILLKVRFADVDRSATSQFGMNLLSTGAGNTPGVVTTGQFTPPSINAVGNSASFTFSNALNVFLYRPSIDLGATIQALEAKNLVQILAEPNLMTTSGSPANFLAGGEFPFPTLQGGGNGIGQITIQFREFGVRLKFLPTVTPRGTIHLSVTPEVSALDYTNSLQVQGYTIPGLSVRRMQTDIELEDGQSFVIGGLIDNRLTETIDKIPGLSKLPLLGKLFQSRSVQKNNSELLVLVTPEIVRPIQAGEPKPEIKMPGEFLKGAAMRSQENPPATKPVWPTTVPVEQLMPPSAAAEPPAAASAPTNNTPANEEPMVKH
jgi:pilus assembly protein CpaC